MQKATPREDGESVLSSCNMDFAGAAAYVVVARTVLEKMKVPWVVQAVVFKSGTVIPATLNMEVGLAGPT